MAPDDSTVYLNGRFTRLSEASVPATDRGFLFGDGVYEVYRIYRGQPFRMKEHLERLRRSVGEVRLTLPELDWGALHAQLLERNALGQADATVYIEVTRGAPASRTHAFPPAGTEPTLLVMARRFVGPPPELYERGVRVITRPDIRWGRCDIKSVNLLPNVLANQDAHEAGAWEAIFVRDGVVTEGTHTNVLAVVDGRLVTHPEGPRILSGVTRGAVLEAARGTGIEVVEAPFVVSTLERATEVLLAGTSAEVLPVVQVDHRPVADGRPGPVSGRLLRAFRALAGAA